MCVSFSLEQICQLLVTKSSFFSLSLSFFFFSLYPFSYGSSFPFIFTHRLSQPYTWRAEIVFLRLLFHSEHTSKLLLYNLSCATTVHGRFLINAARGVVVLYLMWRGWFLHPSPFILLVTRAKSTFFPLCYFNFMHFPQLMLVPKVS